MVLQEGAIQFLVPHQGPPSVSLPIGTVALSGDPCGVDAEIAQDMMHSSCTSPRAQDQRTFMMLCQKGLDRPLKSPNVGVVADPSFGGAHHRVHRAHRLGLSRQLRQVWNQ